MIATKPSNAQEIVAVPELIRGYKGKKEQSIWHIKLVVIEKLRVHDNLPVSSK